MTAPTDLLDHAKELFPEPESGVAEVRAVVARRERNRRLAAGLVVAAIWMVIVATALILRSHERDLVPVDRTPPAAEVLSVSGGDLVALDVGSGEMRTIVKASALPKPGDYTDGITSAAWSPDRTWVAFRAGGLWFADATGGAPQRLTPDQGWDPWAWSPTEDQLAFAHGRDVTVVDVATGHTRDLGTANGSKDIEGVAVHRLVWSPDGRRIAYDGGPEWGSVYAIDVESGAHTSLVRQPAGTGRIDDIDWSPDGAHVAITYESASQDGPNALYLANADGSDARLVAHLVAHQWGVFIPGMSVGTAWSPDGTRLAYTNRSGQGDHQVLQLWTVSPNGSAPTLVASPCCLVDRAGQGPVWSPDGLQIAFSVLDSSLTSYNEGDVRYVVVDADGTSDPRQINERVYESWAGGWNFCFCYG